MIEISFDKKIRIGFMLICKNEEDIITEAFDSAFPFIDYILVCDTGSTDNTVSVINHYLENNFIDGKVIYKEWVDFGTNKTFLLENAFQIKEIDYWMFLDCDEIFVHPDKSPTTEEDRDHLEKIFKENPSCEVFYMTTHSGSDTYRRWQIIKNDKEFEWIFPVHEILVRKDKNSYQQYYIDWLINVARKKPKKTSRGDWDVRVLKEYHEKYPQEPRTVFYLAQTLQGIDWKESAKYYKMRSKMTDGYMEEAAIALLRLGQGYNTKGKYYKAMKYLKRFITARPHRVEGYYYLIQILANLGFNKDAFEIGSNSLSLIKYYDTDLFVEKWLFDWRMEVEVAMRSYYSKDFGKGAEIISRLITQGKIPKESVEQYREQLNFFLPNIDIWRVSPKAEPAVMIIDNFYEDPYSIREFALKQKFDIVGNYPGKRTISFANDNHKAQFEKILNKKITNFNKEEKSYNGCFQWCSEQTPTWTHRDANSWSALAYLSPSPSVGSGTTTYQHKETKLFKSSNSEEEKLLNNDANNLEKWEECDKIGNKFNRLVLFCGKNNHRASNYDGFSSELEKARLFQIFFFD